MFLLVCGIAIAQSQPVPALERQGKAVQLMVDGKPFLMLGGELGNSSGSSKADIDRIFPKLSRMHLNTVLVPAYWELIEPTAGKYDFTIIDHVIRKAEENHLKVVFLWFGAWKNSMSCYAPLWFKENYRKYPRAISKDGRPQEMACAYSEENLKADRRAFVRFMRHLAETDTARTVVMIQVENEIGMIPDARDYCKEASRRFEGKVPQALTDYLKQNENKLHPVLAGKWQTNGKKMQGTWKEVFGEGVETEEIFTAWGYACYVQELAAAGKEAYPLPMFLNAALDSRGRKPGAYPAGGPLARLKDIWRCAAPAIDLLAPDIYDPGFTGWCEQYHLPDNPLFIPEIRLEEEDGVRALYAFGEHDALGFSPFSIEDAPGEGELAQAYRLLHALWPLMTEKQGLGKMNGLWFDGEQRERRIKREKYTLVCRHDYTLGWSPQAKETVWPETGAVVIELSADEYLVGGNGVVITFEPSRQEGQEAGIGMIEEVEIREGKICPVRRLNGDQSHQGRHLRIPAGEWQLQYVRLYRYGK